MDIFSLPDLVLQKSISLKPGLTSLSLTSDGRWAFALNPNQDQVSVIDVSTGELRHTFNIGGAPDEVPFGKETVYIRPLNGTSMFSFLLSDLDAAQTPGLTEIPYGQRPPGQSAEQSISNPLAALPDEGAVLIANPAEFFAHGCSSFTFARLTPRCSAKSVAQRGLGVKKLQGSTTEGRLGEKSPLRLPEASRTESKTLLRSRLLSKMQSVFGGYLERLRQAEFPLENAQDLGHSVTSARRVGLSREVGGDIPLRVPSRRSLLPFAVRPSSP